MSIPLMRRMPQSSHLAAAAKLNFKPIGWGPAALSALVAVVFFQLAYFAPRSGWPALGIVGYVTGLVVLSRLKTTRMAFYAGLVVGFLCVAPQLICFWTIFGAAAIGLWLILAFWIGLFVALARFARVRLNPRRAALLIPFLWTGLEYFRSELYYLKFSWMNVGYAFSEAVIGPWAVLGFYGIGFVIAGVASLLFIFERDGLPLALLEWLGIGVIIAILTAAFFQFVSLEKRHPSTRVKLAGLQLEFPTEDQILKGLNTMLTRANDTNLDIVVLPEYTLEGEPSDALKEWCQANQKFLVVGGKQPAPGSNFYDTAFVISTNGQIVFTQVKCVPIQFMKDGLPATEQKLWESPWGKIGLCVCYDLSYTQVTDELIRQGAQMIIVPTMDVIEWGRQQHELHARVAPVRAAEHGVPIFRVASSGISQGVAADGRVQTSAPFPGEGDTLFFTTTLPARGKMPVDRWLAPLSVGVTVIFILWVSFKNIMRFFERRPRPA